MVRCLLPVACYEAQDSVSSHLPVAFGGRPGCLVCHVYLSPTVAWRPERENLEVTATSTSTQLLLFLPLPAQPCKFNFRIVRNTSGMPIDLE